VGLLDGRLVALNRESGKIEWTVQTTPAGSDYTITGAPRVARDKVIIGNGGAEYGVRGYVTAYDVETGEQVWRTHTVPGNPADGFESEAMRVAADTWSGDWWVAGGGGTVWDAMVYDDSANLVYLGTESTVVRVVEITFTCPRSLPSTPITVSTFGTIRRPRVTTGTTPQRNL